MESSLSAYDGANTLQFISFAMFCRDCKLLATGKQATAEAPGLRVNCMHLILIEDNRGQKRDNVF